MTNLAHGLRPAQTKRVECPELVEGQYAVYILICSDQSYYTGYTNNVRRRLSDHSIGIAATWTLKRLPVHLAYCEIHPNLLSANRREKQIKGWNRKKKEKLITGEWNSAGIV